MGCEHSVDDRVMDNWKTVRDLAIGYVDYVKKGYGTTIDNRCDDQVLLVNKIIEHTSPLMYKCAHRLLHGGIKLIFKGQERIFSLKGFNITPNELLADGSMGIIKRIKNYKDDKGTIYSFILVNSTTEMMRNTIVEDHTIKIGLIKYWNIVSLLKNNKKPGECIKEMQKKHDMSFESAQIIYTSFRKHYFEINSPIASKQYDNTSKFEEVFLPDKKNNQYKTIEEEDLAVKVLKVIDTLGERNADIMKMRFGLDGYREHTLQEIGTVYVLTRERIRQIEAKSVKMLKKRAKQFGLDDYLD